MFDYGNGNDTIANDDDISIAICNTIFIDAVFILTKLDPKGTWRFALYAGQYKILLVWSVKSRAFPSVAVRIQVPHLMFPMKGVEYFISKLD